MGPDVTSDSENTCASGTEKKAEPAAPGFGRRWALRAAFMTTGSAYVSYAGGIIGTALLARHLGPQDYGVYAYFVWLCGVLVKLYTAGFGNTAIRFVSEMVGQAQVGQAQGVIHWVHRKYVAGSLLVTALFVFVAPLLKLSSERALSMSLLALAVTGSLAKAYFTLLAAFGKGYGRFEVEAATTSFVAVVNVIGVAALVVFHVPLLGCAVFFVFLCFMHVVVARKLLASTGILGLRGSLSEGVRARLGPHLRWSVVLALLAAVSGNSIETFLLNREVGPSAVAFFALALAFVSAGLNLVLVGASATLLPVLGHAYGREAERGVVRIAGRALGYFQFLGVLIAGVGYFLAFPAVDLFYGERFLEAVWVLQALVVGRGLAVGAGALTAFFVANERQRGRTGILAVTLLFNVAVAVMLVPRYGLAGAVVSSVVTAFADLGIMAVVAVRGFGFEMPWGVLARLCLGGLIAAGLAWQVVGDGGHVVRGIVGASVFAFAYAALTVLLGAWDKEDIVAMRKLGVRIGGRVLGWRSR